MELLRRLVDLSPMYILCGVALFILYFAIVTIARWRLFNKSEILGFAAIIPIFNIYFYGEISNARKQATHAVFVHLIQSTLLFTFILMTIVLEISKISSDRIYAIGRLYAILLFLILVSSTVAIFIRYNLFTEVCYLYKQSHNCVWYWVFFRSFYELYYGFNDITPVFLPKEVKES